MVNQQMLDYIKQQMQQGLSREQIKSSLMANCWQAQDIEECFNKINTPRYMLHIQQHQLLPRAAPGKLSWVL